MTYLNPTFVDVFAGCGGLSLGLMQAGLRGRFAIESDKDAFATLSANLLRRGARYRYNWPRWLDKEPIAIEDFLRRYRSELGQVAPEIDVLVGGPPCQGFSTAGRRQHDDPRNRLFKSYVNLVKKIKPKVVLIENVRGFTMDFAATAAIENYSAELRRLLSRNYCVYERLIDLSDFGVPQRRTRYFLLAFSPDLSIQGDPFDALYSALPSFLRARKLRAPISAKAAISDFEVYRCGVRASEESPGFEEIDHVRPLTAFQKLMNGRERPVTDARLARHNPEIRERFSELIDYMHSEGRLNTSIGEDVRAAYGIKKQALRVLDPDAPAPTITSMPDDLLHYEEPRTLTVRESARLQSIPDWFQFRGKYTTGGKRRRHEVPRYTQVANAVPPLAAEAIGELVREILAANAKNRQLVLGGKNSQVKRAKLAA